MAVGSLGLSDITIEMFGYPTNAVQIFCDGKFDNYRIAGNFHGY